MSVTFPDFNDQSNAVPNAAVAILGNGRSSQPFHQAKRPGLYRNWFKRAMDMTAIVLAAPVVVPMIAVMAAAVAANGGAPFYNQMRVGRNGRVFRMWKLRSMVRDADARMQAYLDSNPEARAEWDLAQKLREDPRITPIGRFLRRSSLDELPQLWNVLRGDMSLVGPRPMMPSQQMLYPGTAYYALRPGITGYWQTAKRNRTTFEARADYDTAYDRDLNFALDIKLLVMTVGVVVNCTGY